MFLLFRIKRASHGGLGPEGHVLPGSASCLAGDQSKVHSLHGKIQKDQVTRCVEPSPLGSNSIWLPPKERVVSGVEWGWKCSFLAGPPQEWRASFSPPGQMRRGNTNSPISYLQASILMQASRKSTWSAFLLCLGSAALSAG